MVGWDPEPGVTVYQRGGHESCCIALHVPGVDPVVRANLGTCLLPFPCRTVWVVGGGPPLRALVSRQLNSLCLIDHESGPSSGAGFLVTPTG